MMNYQTGEMLCLLIAEVSHTVLTVISARPIGGLSAANPVPYQRGPPQEYLEAVTNKRLTEEVTRLLVGLQFD